MSGPDDGDPDEVAARPASAGTYEAGDPEARYYAVPRHAVIIVCRTSLRARTRWHMSLVRRRADVMPCPRCGKKAFVEVKDRTSDSAHFTWPETGDDQG